MTREEYLRRWSQVHGGADTSHGVARWWLSLVYLAARPVAALRVPPDAVSVLGVLVCAAVVPLALAGSRWPLAVAGVVLVGGLLDGVDGAVATMRDAATRWGAVLDAACDRVADTLLVAGLLALGGLDDDAAAVGWLAAGCALVSLLHEYLRARAAAAGLTDVAVVTVGERPTRVAIALMFALGAGVRPEWADRLGLLGLVGWALTGVVGLTQLVVVLRRRLR
ncbi:CDP-alcohol phosphatidyltransferase family protein [Angustibacter aerolatus]